MVFVYTFLQGLAFNFVLPIYYFTYNLINL